MSATGLMPDDEPGSVKLKRRPYCCDCAWYEASGQRPQTCENPAVLGLTQLVVGPYDVRGVDATVARFTEAMCGLDARWFLGDGKERRHPSEVTISRADRMPSEPAEAAGRQHA